MMKKKSSILGIIMALLWSGLNLPPVSVTHAGEILRYSSSAQVREAFGMEGLNAFMEETGVEVDLYVGSSSSAVSRLMNGFSNIASTTERLHFNHQAHGYVETLFCKAP
jgi:phosphate transport system substrate-binding protein